MTGPTYPPGAPTDDAPRLLPADGRQDLQVRRDQEIAAGIDPDKDARSAAEPLEPGWWRIPILLIVIGVCLGVQDVLSPGTSWWLRGPALVASLLLVAQGLLDYENGRKLERELAQLAQADKLAAAAARPGARPGTVQAARAAARQAPADPPEAPTDNGNAVPVVVGLAVWLGLATLAFPTAPPLLLGFSLLASFVLFAHGWKMVQQRK